MYILAKSDTRNYYKISYKSVMMPELISSGTQEKVSPTLKQSRYHTAHDYMWNTAPIGLKVH